MSNIHMAITKAHEKIHEGRSFTVDVNNAALGAGANINIYIKTPNTAARIHATPLGFASTDATFEILRGPTVTAATGVVQAIYNRDENSANTSVVFDNQAVPVVNSSSKNVTVTVDGTIIKPEIFTGKNFGGGLRDENERILLQNTVYVFRLTSNAANNRTQLTVNWYEENV